MTCRNRIVAPGCLVLALLTASCAGRPESQIAETQAAMDEANKERAPQFARGDWDHAMEAWTEAQELLNRNDFGKARTALLTARSRFQKASEISRSHREQFRLEAQNLLGTIDTRYKRLTEELKSARLRASVRKELEEKCADIEREMAKVGELLKQERFMEARDSSQATMRKVYEAEVAMRGSS